MNVSMISEDTFMIYFEDRIHPDVYDKVACTLRYIQQQEHPNIIELVPSYRAVMVQFDCQAIDATELCEVLQLDEDKVMQDVAQLSYKTIRIPVCYGGTYGPDMETVMAAHQLSENAVINLHTTPQYLVYMIGFMPGFPFLGGLDARLHTPRRSEPRLTIPAGSVGIANNQTGIYPSDSPGGWQIIGRTPIRLFDATRTPMMLYQSGDKIQFYPIDAPTFEEIQKQDAAGTLEIEKWVTISDDD